MKLTSNDIKAVGLLFEDRNNAGYVLDFTDKTMREFFESEFSIDIDNDLYCDDGRSKMKRLRCFLKKTERGTVLKVVTRLWEYRKTLHDHPITAQDESIYGGLILKIQGADSQASSGFMPALIVPTGIDNEYYLRGLQALHQLSPQQRG